MTHSPKSEAREWWISESIENHGEYIYQKAIPHSWPQWHPQIHTIEHSAYDQALKRISDLKELLKSIRVQAVVNGQEGHTELINRINKALAADQGEET